MNLVFWYQLTNNFVMKKYLLLFTFLIFGIAFSQVNSGITYQAVIYNPEGEELPGQDNMYAPVTEQDICLRFSFIDSDNGLEYQENILTTTDVFGMVNLIIGNDIQIGGYAEGFDGILWDGSPKNLMVEVDVKGTCTELVGRRQACFFREGLAYMVPISFSNRIRIPCTLLPSRYATQKAWC